MRTRRYLIAALSVLICMVAFSGAQAQQMWTLTLLDPIQCGPPGGTLTYHGTLTNNAQTDLMGSFWVSLPGFHVAHADFDPAFYAATNGGFLPAAGYSGPIFFLTWTGDAPDGYGLTSLLGGAFGVPGVAPEEHDAEYSAQVCGALPAPEPSALLLLGGGFIGMLAWRKRRK